MLTLYHRMPFFVTKAVIHNFVFMEKSGNFALFRIMHLDTILQPQYNNNDTLLLRATQERRERCAENRKGGRDEKNLSTE